MNNIFSASFFLITILGLLSCEGNTTRAWAIENNSSQIISVESDISGNYFNLSDTIHIEVGQTKTIGSTDQLGGQSMPGSPNQYINHLLIINSFKDSLTKDYTIDSNWAVYSEQRKKIPSDYRHEFIFEVSDADFQ